MRVATDNEQLDKAKAEELIRTIPLIPEVEAIDVELYTDNTGDPSLQLTFHLRREVKVDNASCVSFLDFLPSYRRKFSIAT